METLDLIFSPASPARPFPLFQAPHLIALGIIVLINVLLVRWGRTRPEQRPLIRTLVAGVILLNVIAWQLWHAYYGLWTLQYMLPLHLCGFLQWSSFFLLTTRHPRIYEFVYFLGLGGATQALLTPDSGNMGFPHFRAFETMISHGSIVTAAIYFTFVEGYRPTWESVKRVIVGTQLYAIAIFFLNFWLGSNYMFLARKPDVPSLIDALGPWPLYIIPLELIAFATIFLLYLPWALQDRQRRPHPLAPSP
jgi:hypothetical integral membrane protein (TIGR02206 family)